MYKIPTSLTEDIDKFRVLAEGYKAGKVTTTEFKAFRVPMGVYEQRQDEVYMVRIRATGGVIVPSNLSAIIDIARKHRSNLLHITDRQEIQIQNLQLDEVEGVLRALQGHGLAAKGGGGNTIRNILVNERSGIDADETFDPTPYAIQLTTKLIAENETYLMPRKLKTAFSNSEKNLDYAAVNDLGLVAKTSDGEKGFEVWVAGGCGLKPTVGWKLYDFVPASDLYAVAVGLRHFFYENGNRKNRNQARMRFLFYKWGEEEALRRIRGYVDEARKTEPKFTLEPFGDERPPYSYKPKAAQPYDKVFSAWRRRYAEAQPQEGYSTVLVPVLLGNIDISNDSLVETWKQLVDFVSQFGDHTLRFTTTQSVRLRNIPDEALPELYTLLQGIEGKEIAQPRIVNNIVSCTGADTCRLGLALSKGLATAIRKELLKSDFNLDPVGNAELHITGCPNLCGQPLWGDIGFVGRVLRNDRAYPAYQVYLGANRRTEPQLARLVGTINAKDAPLFVRRLFEAYIKSGALQPFSDFVKGEGRQIAIDIIDDYAEVPSFADDKNYYFDWGAEEIFTVTRGKAECSAGLFDMLDVDKAYITETREALSEAPSAEQRKELLAKIVFYASRMLLVTRGIDPKDDNEIYTSFLEQFIGQGIVDSRFAAIVEKARSEAQPDFTSEEDLVLALGQHVIDLYAGMDDSLQFKKKEETESIKDEKTESIKDEESESGKKEESTEAIARQKDLRGVLCPMNFVRTKLELASMKSGELLEIWLDDGQPVENVPRSVTLEGHTVRKQTQTPEGYWKIIIEKQ